MFKSRGFLKVLSVYKVGVFLNQKVSLLLEIKTQTSILTMIKQHSILEYIIIHLDGLIKLLYEYRCKTCGHQFKKMMRFDEVLTMPTCPEYEIEETEKKLSVFVKAV
jgi:putative FmdB family regulatory protein